MSNSAEEAKAAAQIAAEEAEIDALLCPQRQQTLAGRGLGDGKLSQKRRANRNSPPQKRTRHSDDAGDISRMKVPELRTELGKLGLGTKGIKAVLVARLTAATKAGAGAPAAAASAAAPSRKPDPAALLAAFDFELSQELKARMLGRKAKWLAFKHRYDRDFSTSHLFARAIRQFGCFRQDHALASYQALAVLSAELPDLAMQRIRQFINHGSAGGRLVWDPGALVAAGWDKKRIRARCREYLHRPEVSAGKNGTLRLLVENAPGATNLGNERAGQRIVAVEGGNVKAAAARARVTLGLASLDTSKPHTLTIKVSLRWGWSDWDSRCIGLMQVPNDASVEDLPGWIHDLEGDADPNNDEYVNYGYEEITVTDPNVAEARRSILSMGPRRRCCDAAAPSQRRQHERGFSRDAVMMQQLENLEDHAWDAPDVHSDIIDRLQEFDREHAHKVTARVSRMSMARCDYEHDHSPWDYSDYEDDDGSPGGSVPVQKFELRNRGGRAAVCKYVKGLLCHACVVHCIFVSISCFRK